MPTGTKIAAIVLVVLLGAAGLYYAFFPPATPPKLDVSKGSSSSSSAGSGLGLGTGSGLADPLSRPSTLPPAGASSSAIGGIDALAGRTAPNIPGVPTGQSTPGAGVPGSTASNAIVPGSTIPGSTIAGAADSGATGLAPTTTNRPSFQNGPSKNPAVGSLAPNTNLTAPGGLNSGSSLNGVGTGTTSTGSVGTGNSSTGNSISTPTGTSGTSGTSTLQSSGSESTYVVKKGDTFETISKSVYGSTSKWKEISKANPTVDPTRMKIGAKLRIPAAGASISSENSVATATPKSTSSTTLSTGSNSGNGSKSTVAGATSSGTHVIAKGDTFSSLARTYYGDSKFWKAIAKANPKISEKSLSVGTKVAIPPKSAVVSGGNVER